ncbi:hypothetical protein A4A49_03432 [Nicotiana attenuata]|uniref:Uncharacterized protein n=1 Tax=Nicotiana attenuata TaxID=49451 RepID=A0A314KZP4_NICAT|nr:hypothetical protein A4A49_03432 [Nicotiana attenuata]
MAITKVVTFTLFMVLIFAVWFHLGDTASCSTTTNANKQRLILADAGNTNDLDLSAAGSLSSKNSPKEMLRQIRKLQSCCFDCPCFCDDSNCPACCP